METLFYVDGKTINIFLTSNGEWQYDIYKGTLNHDELDDELLIDGEEGGLCTGTFIDAMEMAGVPYMNTLSCGKCLMDFEKTDGSVYDEDEDYYVCNKCSK